MTTHSFKERNRYAATSKAALVWEPFYRAAFPGFAAFAELPAERSTAQLLGIDHVVVLTSGKELRIDTKIRDRVYQNDVLLEYLSDEDRAAPGWIEKDLAIDFLAVVWEPSHKGMLLPWEQLRRAWLDHGREWVTKGREGIQDPAPVFHKGADGFGHTVANNREGDRTWRTLAVCVPTRVLANAVRDALFVSLPTEATERSIERRPRPAIAEQLGIFHRARPIT